MTTRNETIVQYARTHAYDLTNAEIGEHFGVTGERIRAILKRHGYVKPKKAATYNCEYRGVMGTTKPRHRQCRRTFTGTKAYSGREDAKYCPKHRQPTRR
jgi:hypothetical protein